MLGVEQLFYDYKGITNDDHAAATLVLADVMRTPAQPDYLTVKQAADLLSVSPQTIYHLCASGQLTPKRYGTGRGTIRIPLTAIKSYQHSTARRLIR